MTKQEYLEFVRLWIRYYEPRDLRELRYRLRTCPKPSQIEGVITPFQNCKN